MGWLSYLGTPALVTAGCILNLLTIMVFCRKKMRKYCLSLSMVCLAISDTAVLIIPVLLTWMDEAFFDNYYINNTIWCNLHGYTDLVSCGNSSWIIILISTERWFAVCKPWKKSRIFTNKRVAVTLSLIFLFSIIFSLYFPISLHIAQVPSENNQTESSNECQIYLERTYSIFGALSVMLIYIIPFFVLAFLNTMIIIKLRQRPFQSRITNYRKKIVEMKRISLRIHLFISLKIQFLVIQIQ